MNKIFVIYLIFLFSATNAQCSPDVTNQYHVLVQILNDTKVECKISNKKILRGSFDSIVPMTIYSKESKGFKLQYTSRFSKKMKFHIVLDCDGKSVSLEGIMKPRWFKSGSLSASVIEDKGIKYDLEVKNGSSKRMAPGYINLAISYISP